MHIARLLRPSGRTGAVLCLALGLSAVSLPARADDPNELLISTVGTIVSGVNQATCPTRDTVSCPGPTPIDLCDYLPGICGNPPPLKVCDYVPGAPVVCKPVGPINPCRDYPWLPGICQPVQPPPVPAVEITSLQTAIAIGNIRPDVGVTPRPPDPVINLLGFCQPYLNQFLGNTEYLGPLLDYAGCINAGAVPSVLATLPVVTNNVSFLAGVCQLITSAYQDNLVTFVDFTGTTDCRNGYGAGGTFVPGITARAILQNFLRQEQSVPGPMVSGAAYASSNSRYGAPIASFAGATAKVRLETTISPQSRICTLDNVNCGFRWIVLPNKNPDSGTALSCREIQESNSLVCASNGIVMTDSTIAHK